jgi:hypothetical protein
MDRPEDLLDYDEAARVVDRSRDTIRAWVRSKELQSWPADEQKQNAKRLVSKAELLNLVVHARKVAVPGGPNRAPDVSKAELEAERARVSSLETLVLALRGQISAQEGQLSAERERGEVERLRATEWKDRAAALEAELQGLRAAAGGPWWRRLLGG